MTEPPPYPPQPATVDDVRQEWLSRIQSLMDRCRRGADTDADAQPPAWILLAARQVTDFMHEHVTAAQAQAVAAHTDVRARLTDAQATRDQLRHELDLLRGNVRNFMADTLTCAVAPERADANAALRAWGVDTLPARYTVTLTAILDATVIADDEHDAGAQAHQILHELVRDYRDETVELGEIRTDQVSEHDEPPDLTTR